MWWHIFMVPAVIVFTVVARAEGLNPDATISILFQEIRPLLPLDGEVISHLITEDRWPKNKEPFDRNEMLLICFGREVKSKKNLGEGIVAADGHLQLLAGWRLHKAVPDHGDYFDGTLQGKLSLSLEGGQLHARLYDVDVKWHKSFGAKVLNFLNLVNIDSILTKLAEKIETEANARLMPRLQKQIDEQLRKRPELAELRQAVFLKIRSENVIVELCGKPLQIVSIPEIQFMPPHVPPSDKELNGDPHVQVIVNYFIEGNAAYVRVFMSAKERRGDHTEASGWSNPTLCYQPPAGWKLLGIPGETSITCIDKVVRGHQPRSVSTPLGEFTVSGDRKGLDAGVYSQVICRFDRKFAVAMEQATSTDQTRGR